MAVNISAQLVIALGTLTLPPQSRIQKLWPAIIGLLALIILGATTVGLEPALGGFFVITFVYVGLTQPSWTSLWLIPPASFGWLLLNEPLGLWQALGGVLILFGIYLARPRAEDRLEVGP